MKRKSYTTDLEAREKFNQLKASKLSEDIIETTKQIICRKIDQKVNLMLRKDTTVTFNCSYEFVLQILGDLEH